MHSEQDGFDWVTSDVESLLGYRTLFGADDPESFRESGTSGLPMMREPQYGSQAGDRSGVRRETYRMALAAFHTTTQLKTQRHYEMTSQFLRSGTSPAANVAEFKYAESDADRRHKLSVALKEANECLMWTTLLNDTKVLPPDTSEKLLKLIPNVITILEIFRDRYPPRK